MDEFVGMLYNMGLCEPEYAPPISGVPPHECANPMCENDTNWSYMMGDRLRYRIAGYCEECEQDDEACKADFVERVSVRFPEAMEAVKSKYLRE